MNTRSLAPWSCLAIVALAVPAFGQQATVPIRSSFTLVTESASARPGTCASAPKLPFDDSAETFRIPVLKGCQRVTSLPGRAKGIPLLRAKDGNLYHDAADWDRAASRNAEARDRVHREATGADRTVADLRASAERQLKTMASVLRTNIESLSMNVRNAGVLGGGDYERLLKRARGDLASLERAEANLRAALREGAEEGVRIACVAALKETARLSSAYDARMAEASTVHTRIGATATKLIDAARTVQKVAVKAAGVAVLVFTGGNRAAQCLTEAGMQTAVDTVGAKIEDGAGGPQLTVSGVGKTALMNVVLHCGDALTSGPGAGLSTLLRQGLEAALRRISSAASAKAEGWWRKIKGSVLSTVERLSVLLPESLVQLVRDEAEPVVAAFAQKAIPCAGLLLAKNAAGAMTCLKNAVSAAGKAAVAGAGVAGARQLFDAAIAGLSRGAQRAKAGLEGLAAKLPVGAALVKEILDLLGKGVDRALGDVGHCRSLITALEAKVARAVFGCVRDRLRAARPSLAAAAGAGLRAGVAEAAKKMLGLLGESLEAARKALGGLLKQLQGEAVATGPLSELLATLGSEAVKKAYAAGQTTLRKGLARCAGRLDVESVAAFQKSLGAAATCAVKALRAAGKNAAEGAVKGLAEGVTRTLRQLLDRLTETASESIASLRSVAGQLAAQLRSVSLPGAERVQAFARAVAKREASLKGAKVKLAAKVGGCVRKVDLTGVSKARTSLERAMNCLQQVVGSLGASAGDEKKAKAGKGDDKKNAGRRREAAGATAAQTPKGKKGGASTAQTGGRRAGASTPAAREKKAGAKQHTAREHKDRRPAAREKKAGAKQHTAREHKGKKTTATEKEPGGKKAATREPKGKKARAKKSRQGDDEDSPDRP